MRGGVKRDRMELMQDEVETVAEQNRCADQLTIRSGERVRAFADEDAKSNHHRRCSTEHHSTDHAVGCATQAEAEADGERIERHAACEQQTSHRGCTERDFVSLIALEQTRVDHVQRQSNQQRSAEPLRHLPEHSVEHHAGVQPAERHADMEDPDKQRQPQRPLARETLQPKPDGEGKRVHAERDRHHGDLHSVVYVIERENLTEQP